MNSVALDARWRVRLKTEFDVPAARDAVWEIVSDFRRFVCTDHFHKDVTFTDGYGQVGSKFLILHRFLGVGVKRRGRVLRWERGVGFAYSDLSDTNPQSAFPHVFFVDLVDFSAVRCVVRIRVNGRWTASYLGRVVTRLWLQWNLITIRQGVQNLILTSLIRAPQSP